MKRLTCSATLCAVWMCCSANQDSSFLRLPDEFARVDILPGVNVYSNCSGPENREWFINLLTRKGHVRLNIERSQADHYRLSLGLSARNRLETFKVRVNSLVGKADVVFTGPTKEGPFAPFAKLALESAGEKSLSLPRRNDDLIQVQIEPRGERTQIDLANLRISTNRWKGNLPRAILSGAPPREGDGTGLDTVYELPSGRKLAHDDESGMKRSPSGSLVAGLAHIRGKRYLWIFSMKSRRHQKWIQVRVHPKDQWEDMIRWRGDNQVILEYRDVNSGKVGWKATYRTR